MPSLGGQVVARAGFDPAIGAVFGGFLFPKGGAGFEEVHDEFAGEEGILTVGTRDRHEDDIVERLQDPCSVHHADIQKIPAFRCFLADALDGAFGHTGIVFQRHLRDLVPGVDIAHTPDEGGDRPGLGGVATGVIDDRAGIEWLLLDADTRDQSSRSPKE